jgi:hypothetical protein
MSISSGGQRGLRSDGGAAMLLDGRAFGQGSVGGLLTYYMVRPIQLGCILVHTSNKEILYTMGTREFTELYTKSKNCEILHGTVQTHTHDTSYMFGYKTRSR